jgi:hypothetical protein
LRHGDLERLGGLELDDQLEFGGVLHRQVHRLAALEDAVDIRRRLIDPPTIPA